jgi:hypothetical protein
MSAASEVTTAPLVGWRPPLAAIPPHLRLRRVYELWLGEVREDLERRRRAVEPDRNDLLLRLGQHDLVLADAPTEAATDERLAGQVMLAPHRRAPRQRLTRLRRTTDEPAAGVFRP